jgi:hypothetical protein
MKLNLHKLRVAAAPIAVALATFGSGLSQADVPFVDPIGHPAIVLCKVLPNGAPVRAVHMDKIIFRITGALTAANAADQPQLDAVPRNTVLDIKVLDDPRTVADLKAKVLTFLGAMVNPANRLNLDIPQVAYAVVCPNPEGAGG